MQAFKPVAPASTPGRKSFWTCLLVLIGIATIVRIAILTDQRAHNPYYSTPRNDESVYWDWAGRIADGHWLDSKPFLSAPLYPYLVALIRVSGGEFTSLYVIQLVMQVAAAFFLADAARRRFGPAPALLAVVLFFLLADPAAHVCRVLNNSLQLLLVCVLFWWIARTHNSITRSFPHAAILGFLLGLNALANPPMILLLPLLAARLFLLNRPRRAAIAPAALMLAVSAATIAPATLHNYLACGEFIPVRHAGAAVLFGNQPGTPGIYAPAPDINLSRGNMYRDAEILYTRETGKKPTWNGMERFYATRVLNSWVQQPGAMAVLLAKKIYWFFTGHYYDDIRPPFFEIGAGFAKLLQLAPLPASWVLVPALLAAIFLLAHPIRNLPELALLAIPLFAVAAFQYTPRYRMPALPIAAVLTSTAVLDAFARSSRRAFVSAVAAAVAAGVVVVPINRAAGLDDPIRCAPLWHGDLALLLEQQGRHAEAALHLVETVKLLPDDWRYRLRLGVARYRAGDHAAGLVDLIDAQRLANDDPTALKRFAIAYDAIGDLRSALGLAERSLKTRADDDELRVLRDDLLRRLAAQPPPSQPTAPATPVQQK